ncbi:MSEP-CTERM sorting domain-containing protein [Jejuia spongiicola]|uniref:MSEP-CTERM sorting domain-containing protein n=1 Tax=Jejuia spongiicola TaxID=2942207 RepID=A0ABT0QHU4_9FLAO|nr:MSEP-CTERM sorting domain-containing protein [Jejuia spongiicola]MCL6296563.1 MSEP-CTERM sorting domain-containing protein [Jejuia spongiicola]
MKNLLNPKWLIVINTIPVILLSFIYYNEFDVIKTLLEEDSIQLWYNFGGILFGLSILLLGYVLYSIQQKKEVSVFYAFSALSVYTIYLYIYSIYSSDIIPWNIPRWMLSQDSVLYPGTFLMPTLAHALFIIVIKLTSKAKGLKAWKSFLLALSIPLLTYIFAQIILPLWQPTSYRYNNHVLVVGLVVGVILFLFFLIRSIYILSIKKGKNWSQLYLAAKFLVGVVFPLLGLLINNKFNSVFGDFNTPWFYIIALTNGLLICVTSSENKQHRLILFITRCITYSFTFYFFIVFLPFLPLSVIAIVAIGLGFLMLTPLVLFIIHTQELSSDYKFLKNFYSKQLLIISGIIGFLVIPTILALSYQRDKIVLHETLDYLYNPNYSKDYNINKESLKKTLEVVKHNKSRNSDFFMSSQTPYLSSFFNWIVLDNLTLSDIKIKTIEKIFFNTKPFELRAERLRNKNVDISNISSNSTYNETDNTWTSWIDLEITNANKDNFTSEYATTIDLPNGCWINDYYLYVGDRKEMGILAEKKSAMWIFSQIRNINQDPGLLHYLTGNKVSFRVFPFSENEIRRTGIQFIHKEPITIKIDNHKLTLGEKKETLINHKKNDQIVYISSKEKETLKKIKRKPYYHFIIDTSHKKDSLINNYIKVLDDFITTNNIDTMEAKISFANTFVETEGFNGEWKNSLKEQEFEGGFYLERAIKKVLFNSYTNLSNKYPIIIVVTDNMLDAVINKNFADFKIAFPESNSFYHLNTLGYLASHSLVRNPKDFVNDNTVVDIDNEVLAWPNPISPVAYLPNDSLPNIVLKNSVFDFRENAIGESNWNTGLHLQGKWLSDIFYPENTQTDWNNAVKMSFKSKIMTPLTSYIVVENEAQKAALLKKQKEVLAGKKSLDLNERTQRMSEPKLILLLILIGVFLFLRRRQIINNYKPST